MDGGGIRRDKGKALTTIEQLTIHKMLSPSNPYGWSNAKKLFSGTHSRILFRHRPGRLHLQGL